MAKGPRYKVPYRRRREAKTDYNKRRILATSNNPRFVYRSSNNNIIIQIINSKIDGDRVITQANTSDIEKFGWRGCRKNTSASYLVGMLAGYKALQNGIKIANLDIGLARPSKGSRVFAALKGALDAGLEIPFDSEIIPDQTRIEGKSILEFFKSFQEDELKNRFSGYFKRGLNPLEMIEHFREIRTKIQGNSKI